jgi:hypothetical protein
VKVKLFGKLYGYLERASVFFEEMGWQKLGLWLGYVAQDIYFGVLVPDNYAKWQKKQETK